MLDKRTSKIKIDKQSPCPEKCIHCIPRSIFPFDGPTVCCDYFVVVSAPTRARVYIRVGRIELHCTVPSPIANGILRLAKRTLLPAMPCVVDAGKLILMPQFKLPLWPVQVSQPDDFIISGLESPFQAHYVVHNFSRDFRARLQTPSMKSHQSKDGHMYSKPVTAPSCGSTNYGSAFQRWKDVLRGLRLHATQHSFSDQTETNSYKLLKEWWDNNAYDSEVTVHIREWIEQAARLLLDTEIRPRLVSSRYNLLLFDLWRAEFCYETPTENDLFSKRMMAAAEAACHRLAANSLVTILSRNSGLELQRDSPDHELPDQPQQMLHEVESPMTAGIHPCSWLDPDDDAPSSPYFLWDRLESRTVVTRGLASPKYIAISHTWGRWRKTPSSDVLVQGVPWQVPENTLFEAVCLPALLALVPFPARYIWFDLVCIPQDMSHPVLGPRAKVEIANQATIFKSASLACAWFN